MDVTGRSTNTSPPPVTRPSTKGNFIDLFKLLKQWWNKLSWIKLLLNFRMGLILNVHLGCELGISLYYWLLICPYDIIFQNWRDNIPMGWDKSNMHRKIQWNISPTGRGRRFQPTERFILYIDHIKNHALKISCRWFVKMSTLFNGGWAVLETLDSFIDLWVFL